MIVAIGGASAYFLTEYDTSDTFTKSLYQNEKIGLVINTINPPESIDDIDLATNLSPKDVKESFKKKGIDFYETGIKHGTITSIIEGNNFVCLNLKKI